jgi:hypothetical protein
LKRKRKKKAKNYRINFHENNSRAFLVNDQGP